MRRHTSGIGCGAPTMRAVDGAPGGRRVLSPEDSRVSPDARRVRTTPAKRVSPALWGPPGVPFPVWETEKGMKGLPWAFKEYGR